MSVRGIGIDVGSIPRIAALEERYGQRFVRRWFDASEFAEPPDFSPLRLASLFAAKEAVWKALRTAGDTPLPWRQIIITPQGSKGALSVRFEGDLACVAAALGIGPVRVTTVVLDDVVIAVAVAEDADRQ